ncbi:MAG: zf-HC2 domain-containing protein [Candidatus Aminicenantes bacterium]|nr:zf-HC2 domain-containing protein [Candidatus Aminicenantes bacterium]
MRCTTARKRISEYIDGGLDEVQSRTLEEHCASCPGCQKLMKDLQTISRRAGDLAGSASPETPWLKIQKKLTTGEQKVLKAAPQKLRWLGLPRLSYAVSAALVLAVVVGIFVLRPLDRNQQGFLYEPGSQKYTLAKLEEAEHHYQLAIKALAEAVTVKEGELDPQMAEVFRTNLAIVDASIDACKKAVLSDPDDIESRNYLLAAYREKTNLLTEMMVVSDKPSRKTGMEETL